MKPELYQRAKVVFSELVNLAVEDQRAALLLLEATEPELAKETRSLLDYHTAHSLVVEPAAKRIQNRTSFTTAHERFSLRSLLSRDPWRMLLVGAPIMLLAWLACSWICADLQRSIGDLLASQLNLVIDEQRDAFRRWESTQIQQASSWARDPEVLSAVHELVKLSESHRPESPELPQVLAKSPHADTLGDALHKLASRAVKFAVWDRRMLTLADWNQKQDPSVLGQSSTADGAAMLQPIMNGQTLLILPKKGKTVTEDYRMETRAPVVSVFLPIRDPTGSVVAALMLRDYGLEEEFQEITRPPKSLAQVDSYLLNRDGVMMTACHRADQAKRAGLIAEDGAGLLAGIRVRDPGVDLCSGDKPADTSPMAWPLTQLASSVTSGHDGVNTTGYRNYLGRRVVGAWRWDKDFELGFALEQDFDIAHAAYFNVRRSVSRLLGLCSLGLIIAAVASAWLHKGRNDSGALREVGPYKIREILGEGGMGKVYLAEHFMLRRPTAVKVLHADSNDAASLTRFEREVQLACQLTHPNAISIYDFGRTTSGIFYYTMEYIQGAHLGQLLEYAGPIPAGRCIHILGQLCRALREAHQAGLVHRDIKPQNVMICNRGGEPDFVKLLDYGLVKAFAPGIDDNSLQTKVVVGTPRFMAPERMASPWLADPRVDIYSVGALAYFLLTGQLPPLISSAHESGVDALPGETVELPANVTQFGHLLSSCMATNPALRPANISVVLQQLDDLATAHPWKTADAAQWWKRHENRLLELVKEKRERLAERG